jgi:hypothetical protein
MDRKVLQELGLDISLQCFIASFMPKQNKPIHFDLHYAIFDPF